ncbi:MAG: hypothetical protein WKF77_03005 [Planctomycetaceae bacterium]
MMVSPQCTTPAPWSNVIANPDFGCLLTESGGGYTWFGNSRENKLTVWSNDPTSDSPSEIVYLKDIDSELHWSPVSSLDQDVTRRIVHGQGFSIFRSEFRFSCRRNKTIWHVHAVRNSSNASKICTVNLIEDGREHDTELVSHSKYLPASARQNAYSANCSWCVAAE